MQIPSEHHGPRFTDGATEATAGNGTGPRSHSQEAAEWGLFSRQHQDSRVTLIRAA